MKIGGSKMELISRLTGVNSTLDFGRERKRKVEVADPSPAKRSTKCDLSFFFRAQVMSCSSANLLCTKNNYTVK